MRVIFLGTPEFGVKPLEALIDSCHSVVGVICQPDRLGNRKIITQPPVKKCAQVNGLNVYQFNRISTEGIDLLKSLNADIMVTAAFGQILSDEVLNLTPYGVINVHASLLPYYRGSCPIHRAIINGEKKTGVTIMQTAKSVDSGDIILQKEIMISEEETTGELTQRLSVLGSLALIEALDLIENGEAVFTPQDHSIATYYPMLSKKDGKIDFNSSPSEVVNFIRGMQPWPSSFICIKDTTLKVLKASIVDYSNGSENGEIVAANSKEGLIVKVKDGYISLDIIQPQGKKAMLAREYLMGKTIDIGTILC